MSQFGDFPTTKKEAVLNPMKNDKKKARFELIDPFFEEELAKVLTYGAEKYADNNWQNLEDGIDRHYAALRRHLAAYRQGEYYDEESGMPHLWHVAANAMFLCYHEREIKHERSFKESK